MRTAAVLTALLLVLAGCSAPTAAPTAEPAPTGTPTAAPGDGTGDGEGDGRASTPTPTPTESPTPTATPTPEIRDPHVLAAEYDIAVRVFDDNLTVDQNLVFARVQVILGTRVAPPEVIDVQSYTEMKFPGASYPPFYRLLGVENPDSDDQLVAAGYVTDPDTVYLNEIIAGEPGREHRVLSHEFGHVVQFRRGDLERARRVVVEGDVDPDERQAYVAMVEGPAMHVQQAYWRQYMGNGTSPAASMARNYNRSEGAKRLVFARYHFGYRYVDARVDSPTEHRRLYRNPPRTTEEVIHRLPPGSEPPANLSVGVEEGYGWDSRPTRTVRMGELFTRVALSTQLNESRAAEAAAGWGDDERHVFVKNQSRGYAWVLKWDDRANATEFATAFRDYLDRRATRNGSVWTDGDVAFRVERVSPRTVVIFLGDGAFVERASASVEDGRVEIRV